MKHVLIISTLVALLAGSASAAVPGIMSYQGLLRDGGGLVVPDGNYTLTFRLYSVASGGVALWTEAQTLAVADGVFNALLGSVTPFGALTFADQYYLGVQVGGNPELSPRVRLASSPYAFTARHVEPNVVSSVDGVVNDEGNIDLVAGANVTITPDDAANTITIAATGGGGGIGGSGTAPYLPVFTAPTTLGNSVMYQTSDGLAIPLPGGRAMVPEDKGDGKGLLRLPTRFNAMQTDGWAILGQEVSSNGAIDGEAGVFGYRGSSNAGTGYGVNQINTGVLGFNLWGDPYTFGVAGYTYGDYVNTGGVFGAGAINNIWGALGYKDNNSNWWGVYTNNSAHVGGLTMPTGAADGRVLTSDAGGNAAWQTPQVEVMDYHNESATTTILSSVTQYDDAHVTLAVPGPGFITVTSSVWLRINHIAGTRDQVAINHSISLNSIGDVYARMTEDVPFAYPTSGQITMTRAVVSTFPVTAAGTYTYYLVGQMISGQDVNDNFYYAQTTGIYHPAALTAVQQAVDSQEQLKEKTEAMIR
jgi:hypothetical protein